MHYGTDEARCIVKAHAVLYLFGVNLSRDDHAMKIRWVKETKKWP